MDTKNKTELAEKAYKLAFDYELEFGCCPQCVLTTVKEPLVMLPMMQSKPVMAYQAVVD